MRERERERKKGGGGERASGGSGEVDLIDITKKEEKRGTALNLKGNDNLSKQFCACLR